MKRCLECTMPDTRPDTQFVDGVCSACITYENRPNIDWAARRRDLEELLDKHHGRCIVPSSAGKDSHFQALTLLEMGADVTLVTASTCYLTAIGRKNIDNLARHARTIEYTPNRSVRAKLNRLGLTLVGDISWPEHVSIFTTPFRAAAELGIPLIFYGENPQNQYGGPLGTEGAREMTLRWRSEFGGFLGLRPHDLVGQDGLTAQDMADYLPPSAAVLTEAGVEAHFLGQYVPWDSTDNALLAIGNGFTASTPGWGNWWHAENLDNAQTGLHDHMMYRKYGYGRGCAQLAVDVRRGQLTREWAMAWIREHDGWFPEVYAGVPMTEMLERIGMTRTDLIPILASFTNWDLFGTQNKYRPILKEFAEAPA